MFANDGPIPKREPRLPPTGIKGFWDGVFAGFEAESLETDYWNRSAHTESAIYDDVYNRLTEIAGQDEIDAQLTERVGRRRLARHGRGAAWRSAIMEIAGEIGAANPKIYGDLPLTADAVTERATAQMRDEYADAVDSLSMTATLPGLAEFMGRGGAALSDPVSLAMLPLGGGGSILRVMGREALLGGLAEAAILPRMFQQSERLDIEDPNPFVQIGMGAGFGALLGGAVTGGLNAFQRGVVYARERNVNDAPAPQEPPVQTAPEPELNPEPEPAPEPVPEPPVVREEGPIAPEPTLPETEEDLTELLRTQADDEETAMLRELDEMRYKHPLARAIIRLGGVKWYEQRNGERVLTLLAQELKNRNITPQRYPGLFRKTGRADLGNIPAGEISPDDATLFGLAEDGTYLRQEGLIDALASEIGGTRIPLTLEAQSRMQRITSLRRQAERAGDEFQDARFDPVPPSADAGQFLDDVMGIRQAVTEFLEESEWRNIVTPEDEVEIAFALAENGGSIEDAALPLIQRQMDVLDGKIEAEDPGIEFAPRGEEDLARVPVDGPEGDVSGRGGETAQPGPVAEAPGSRAEGAGNAGRARTASERTDAGDQLLIEGVDPITQRERLQQAQNAPLRGGDEAADVGLFDAGARAQADMFDDVASGQADDMHAAVMEDLEALAEEMPDLEMDIGSGARPVAEILDDLNADDDIATVAEACK